MKALEELKKTNKYEGVMRVLKEMSSEKNEVDILRLDDSGGESYIEDKLEWDKLDKQRTGLIEMIESNKDIRRKEAESLQDLLLYAQSQMKVLTDRYVREIPEDGEEDTTAHCFEEANTWLNVAEVIEIAKYR